MASMAPPSLPLFYKDVIPLSQGEHGNARYKLLDNAAFLKHEHAVPVTVDEFAVLQRFYPIVFSSGNNPVPLALMGLNEGINTFIDDEGKMKEDAYVPAYVRRYPFILARLNDKSDELSLCVDPTTGAVGDYDEGDPVFEGTGPSEHTRALLQFCEEFEQAGQRTGAFVQELKANDLLMEGEVAIKQDDQADPVVYRGFQMVNEEKLRNLRGDVLRKMMQSGLLPLVHAHMFSLNVMREIFARQINQGWTPPVQPPQLQAS